MRGILFDLPGVVARAKSRIEGAGLAGRCQVKGGSFFDALPAGADAYLMRHIIHDWDDAKALAILRQIGRVITPQGRVLLVEGALPEGNDPSFTKLLDLNMLVILGGKERTAEEYRTLLAQAGFRLANLVPTKAEVCVMEAIPAD